MKAFPLFSITEFKWKPGRNARSEVWNFYTRISEDRVQCEVCFKSFKGGNAALGTTNMRIHLERIHGQTLRNSNKKRKDEL